MNTRCTRVFIIDDYPTISQFLRILIGWEKDFKVCGDALDARRALELLPTCAPDLILLDLLLPDRHGLEVIRDIHLIDPDARILVFTVHDELVFAQRALQAGAQGYVMKCETSTTWFEAMRQVASGHTYLSPTMRTRIMKQLGGDKSSREVHGISQLSNRELEVLQLLGGGRSVSQIAAILSLGRHTIQTYQTRIIEKLGLESTSELMRCAYLWAFEERSRHSEKYQTESTTVSCRSS